MAGAVGSSSMAGMMIVVVVEKGREKGLGLGLRVRTVWGG